MTETQAEEAGREEPVWEWREWDSWFEHALHEPVIPELMAEYVNALESRIRDLEGRNASLLSEYTKVSESLQKHIGIRTDLERRNAVLEGNTRLAARALRVAARVLLTPDAGKEASNG